MSSLFFLPSLHLPPKKIHLFPRVANWKAFSATKHPEIFRKLPFFHPFLRGRSFIGTSAENPPAVLGNLESRPWAALVHPPSFSAENSGVLSSEKGTVDGSEIRRLPVEVGRIYHYLQGFIHLRWLFGISEPSTVWVMGFFHGESPGKP